MLSTAQERLVRWLGRFPRDLAKAWDVPRELSLPGLSDAMGVVRSALHSPLSGLIDAGLVESRLAHVIGGGARRRNVYHLTDSGWNLSQSLPEEKAPASSAAKRGELSGGSAEMIELLGRDSDVQTVLSLLEENGVAVVTGLPGIGKTSLLREVAEHLLDAGRDVAWARATSFDDLSALLSGSLAGSNVSGEVPTSPAAAVEWIQRKLGRGVLVIDELQEVHKRHLTVVSEALSDMSGGNAGLLIGCRAPSPVRLESSLVLGELPLESSLQLLGDEVDSERKEAVVEALGGHPLALKLHEPKADLPEVGADIQNYIEETVLATLPEEVIPGLDELAAMPIPVEATRLVHEDSVGLLDEHALLRWVGVENPAVELQHLVRNVRRAMWDEDTAKGVHAAAAAGWGEHPEAQARLVEFYHRLRAGDTDLEDFLEIHAEGLAATDDGALAGLLEDAIERRPEVIGLWRLAATTALNRGESEVAEDLLEKMPDSASDAEALEIQARLALQKGDVEKAQELLDSATDIASPSQAVRMGMNTLARLLDDRLPGGQPALPVSQVGARALELDLSSLGPEVRPRALVALAILRHSVALLQDEFSAAAALREQLSGLADKSDPILEELAIRGALAEAEYDSADWHRESEALRRLMAEVSPLRSLALRLLLVERLAEHEPEEAAGLIEDADLDLSSDSTARRLLATVWFWRGALQRGKALECWREAIHRYRSAECPHAAQELTQRMHSLLR